MAKKKITQVAEELLQDFLTEEGYELYSSEFVKEGSDWFLRIYIDKVQDASDGEPEYISTDDCEKVSRFLSERLDEADPIQQNYYLEVSSPGMDRPLLKPEHYKRYIGETVEVRLYRAMDGRKEFCGRLDSFSGETVTITEEDGKQWELKLTEIARTRLAVIF